MAQASRLLRSSQPEFWPHAESPAWGPSLPWKLEFFIPILHCLLVTSPPPPSRGFTVGEGRSLSAPDVKLGHVTCFDPRVSDEQRLERASTAEPAPLRMRHSHGRSTQVVAALSGGGPGVRHASELGQTCTWSTASLPSPARLQTHQCVNTQVAI